MPKPKKKKAINLLELYEHIKEVCSQLNFEYRIEFYTNILRPDFNESIPLSDSIELEFWVKRFQPNERLTIFKVVFTSNPLSKSPSILIGLDNSLLWFAERGFFLITEIVEDKLQLSFYRGYSLLHGVTF